MANEFEPMTTAQIRESFITFFEERGCRVFPSSSLIPDDPSLLLTNAGMNQFKQYYLGKKTMKEVGAVSCQKCLRTNDIDVIGSDGRHLSFFEMLGDFSFGGIPKDRACALSLEFITDVLHLPVDRLYFTIFTDDDEAHDIWRSLGVEESHISRLGEDDNFWAAGPTGPCGPCSEIYFDQGEEFGCKAYDENSYEGASRSLRIVADHARAVTFMLSDGIRPGNEGRGYVLRRLLRRAVLHGRLLGIEGAFMGRFADEVVELMGSAYPELAGNAAMVKKFLESEEERFSATIQSGSVYLDEALAKLAPGETLDGRTAFTLHDTFGFPIDLTVEMAGDAGHPVDTEGFEAAMDEQRERARASVEDVAWTQFDSVWLAFTDALPASEFCGYDRTSGDARVLAIVADGESVESAAAGDKVEVVLDRTPFYGERGGQVGDAGSLSGGDGDFSFEVEDTQWREKVICSHVGVVRAGSVSVGDEVRAEVDVARRERIRRNHTATHLLHAALRAVLGEHVQQEGSYVDDERLRFDFTHFSACTPAELAQVESLVNGWIFRDLPVSTQVMGIDEAREAGAIALFSEKYGDRVRVVSAGDVSCELCGGTHARNTSELGLFKVLSESSTGANIRRIEAVTSAGALAYMNERLAVLDEAAAALKCRPTEVPARVEALHRDLKATSDKLKAALTGGASDAIGAAVDAAVEVPAGYRLVVARLDGLEAADLRSAWDTVRGKLSGPAACVLATVTSKGTPALIAAGTDDAVAAGFKAGDVIRAIAPLVGGGGGGRPNMAQAGGKDASGIDAALAAARESLGA